MQIIRDLDTGDSKDYLIELDKDFVLSWAVNTGTSNTNAKHTQHGKMNMMISRAGGPAEKEHTSTDDAAKLKTIIETLASIINDIWMEDSASVTVLAGTVAALHTVAFF